MKVDGLDIDVWIEGVLIEENRAACEMGHVEATFKNVMIAIFGRLLQGSDVPLHRNLFFEGIFFSASGPGFQLWMLSLFCTSDRAAKCLLVLFV